MHNTTYMNRISLQPFPGSLSCLHHISLPSDMSLQWVSRIPLTHGGNVAKVGIFPVSRITQTTRTTCTKVVFSSRRRNKKCCCNCDIVVLVAYSMGISEWVSCWSGWVGAGRRRSIEEEEELISYSCVVCGWYSHHIMRPLQCSGLGSHEFTIIRLSSSLSPSLLGKSIFRYFCLFYPIFSVQLMEMDPDQILLIPLLSQSVSHTSERGYISRHNFPGDWSSSGIDVFGSFFIWERRVAYGMTRDFTFYTLCPHNRLQMFWLTLPVSYFIRN